MKTKFLIILLVFCAIGSAQNPIKVSGSVVTELDEPLPGVSIISQGTTIGTTTDFDGNFEIQVPNNSILEFSYIGFQTQEVNVSNSQPLTVILIEDASQLDEVVVIGYGTVKKSDITGSLSSVKSDEISAIPSSNVMQALNGRAAGVQVKQNSGAPGGAVSVRIRGTNSIQGSNEPLYVIDGFPGDVNTLNNADISNIEILKDASATAIYGSRGANGVVLITTKSGEVGDTKVDFESSYGVQTIRKRLELMNASEYAEFYNEQQVNDGHGAYFSQTEIDAFGEGTDWQDLIFQSAPIVNNTLSISGGNVKTKFAVSGGFFDQEGIIRESGFNRYSLLANINHKINSKISFQTSVKLARTKMSNQNSSGGNRGSSLNSGIISAAPTLSPNNEDGSINNLMISYPFMGNGIRNPLYYIEESKFEGKTNKVIANAAFFIEPIDGLTLKIAGNVENTDYRSDYYQSLDFLNSVGNATVSTVQDFYYLSENTVNYLKTFNEKHSLSAMAGFTYEERVNTSLSGSGIGFLSDITETANLQGAATPGIPNSGYAKNTLISYLGRINYAYDNRYLFTASMRSDGSSKYSEGDKWGYFPSGAFAWRTINEEFMKNQSLFSDLKLRASWGLTGSQAIDPYSTLAQLNSGKTVFGKSLYNTFAPSTSLPDNLKWETTEQKDFGLDVAFLKGRYGFTADYYIKNTRDLLNTVQLPPTSGYNNTIRNVGEVKNSGLELSAFGNILNGSFKWDIDANISFNKSEVVKLYDGQDIISGVDVVFISDINSILREGEPMSVFYGYLDDGYDDNGHPVYVDFNNDGEFSQDDRTIIGDPNPDFIYGLNSTMSFKNLSLTMFWQGSYGNDIANVSAIGNTLDYGYGLNMPKEVYEDHWTPQNTDAKYPKITDKLDMNFSERLIEDGSFLRLRNIELAYNVPVDTFSSLRNMSLFVSGQNLLTLTKYSWWDPEVNSQGGSNSIRQGMDYYSYPTSKSITLGIKLGF
ncbi:TonB-dependent receptor [Aurantibacter sp.]|uniref:SusC/RagA family TonB-linked outer membrane protein n=1 Tax=Aurantibacter sp. TaxID=2807103 RepID=UPI0032669E4D